MNADSLLKTSKKQKIVRVLNLGVFSSAVVLAFVLQTQLPLLLATLIGLIVVHHAALYYIAEKWKPTESP